MESKNSYYENRDLSWLAFNTRCLEEAEDGENPLCERLTFCSIWQTNLDEFCMVRIGGLHDRRLYKKDIVDPKSGLNVDEQLSAIFGRLHKLLKRVDKATTEVEAELAGAGAVRVTPETINKFEASYAEKYFEKEILPLLAPIITANTGRFPFLPGGEIHLGVLVESREGVKNIGVCALSKPIERVVVLPSAKQKYILAEDLMFMFAGKIFKKRKITDKTLFRITRNADLDADEAFADHENLEYRDIMKTLLKKRVRLAPIRIEFEYTRNSPCEERLLRRLKLSKSEAFHREIPLSLSYAGVVRDMLRDRRELFFAPLLPQYPACFTPGVSLMETVKRRDVLLSYPFENINAFIFMLNEAAMNPYVKSIKITLYREAKNSKIVNALISAAENGKKVVAMVELRARFDEDHNITVSKQLEDGGVKVVYGMEDYKVHSKVLLITMEKDGVKSYLTQVGTGNYNEITSRLYTDLSYITARDEFSKDARTLFSCLERGKLVQTSKTLLIAPLCFKTRIMALINEQIAIQTAGGEGRIIFKMNSLSDVDLIDELVHASDAGVKTDLVIRGICCLKLNGKRTRNLTVRSIVGRYLEHSRIYMFGQRENRKIYIASADLMSRNTQRRVEVGAPILDEDAKAYIERLMELVLSDNVKARIKTEKGYEKVRADGEKRVNSQLELYKIAYENAKRQGKE